MDGKTTVAYFALVLVAAALLFFGMFALNDWGNAVFGLVGWTALGTVAGLATGAALISVGSWMADR